MLNKAINCTKKDKERYCYSNSRITRVEGKKY